MGLSDIDDSVAFRMIVVPTTIIHLARHWLKAG